MKCADCGKETKATVKEKRFGVAVPVCSDRANCQVRMGRHRLETFFLASSFLGYFRRVA